MGDLLVSYLKIDIKRLITDKKVLFAVLILLIIAVIDPITVTRHFTKYAGSAETIGQNPFQFWMLMNSVSWGNNLYSTVFWILAVLFTGLIYYEDKNTSLYMYQITRGGKGRYFVSKFISTGMLSFLTVLVTLEINVVMTYKLFPDTINKTEYYDRLVPHAGSFVYNAFLSNPMNMVQIYTLINALAISIFVVFSLCISMLLNFKNRYVILVTPVIILYAINYIFDSYPTLFTYDIRIILQPVAVGALTSIITWENVIIVIGGWILVDLILIGAVFYKMRDCYE
ncbi:hypothetical protein PASE110613_17620 [Paenibacillus sediminis]|uniref:Magnesium-transporting ATPase (P-type) n=1 Tax=Paenibacillus sediminis TaxID=664909 RepID=A0ABS4H4U0_9BACL|nr:hypothetical protein [Paenibacillus sediminis]MBP1937267.1 magnesium-transporting ATPase (P-type) [Paenibacillus sediminis]